MMRAIIVDDEFYFRQYLKSCINWTALECEIVGEASDGKEALELVWAEKPDIAILDINMPIIDGIEFSREIYERKIDMKIIILSGHSEFQYAQRAIKYGVKSYLLKPLNEEELCQVIAEIKEEKETLNSYRKRMYKYNSTEPQEGDSDQISTSLGSVVFINMDIRKQIIMGMRQGDIETVKRQLGDVFENAMGQNISYDMLQCHCMELIFICMEYLGESAVSIEDIFPGLQPLELVAPIRTADHAQEVITQLYCDIMDYEAGKGNAKGLRQLEEIKGYIAGHYCEGDFRINDISEHFYLNYHYLCHSFKKQTGVTLNEYITDLRIGKAKKLIADGCRNMTLLSEEVGYSDLGYFGKCFKKRTGISPSQYIDKMGNKQKSQ